MYSSHNDNFDNDINGNYDVIEAMDGSQHSQLVVCSLCTAINVFILVSVRSLGVAAKFCCLSATCPLLTYLSIVIFMVVYAPFHFFRLCPMSHIIARLKQTAHQKLLDEMPFSGK